MISLTENRLCSLKGRNVEIDVRLQSVQLTLTLLPLLESSV